MVRALSPRSRQVSQLQHCDAHFHPGAEQPSANPPVGTRTCIGVTLLDHLVLNRDALAWRLGQEPGLQVGRCFADVGALLEAAPDTLGEVIVSNYALAADSLDGIALIRVLREQRPRQRLLILTDAASPGLVNMAMRAGAGGVISRLRPYAEIVAGIRALATGHAPIARDPAASPSRYRRTDVNAALAVLDHPWLTEHERDVLRCCLAGLSVSQTAHKLERSAHTISTQKRCAFRKLDIDSDFELFALFDAGV